MESGCDNPGHIVVFDLWRFKVGVIIVPKQDWGFILSPINRKENDRR